jgi:hypothetical protein
MQLLDAYVRIFYSGRAYRLNYMVIPISLAEFWLGIIIVYDVVMTCTFWFEIFMLTMIVYLFGKVEFYLNKMP